MTAISGKTPHIFNKDEDDVLWKNRKIYPPTSWVSLRIMLGNGVTVKEMRARYEILNRKYFNLSVGEAVEIKCLKCRLIFPSENKKSNRICEKCKNTIT